MSRLREPKTQKAKETKILILREALKLFLLNGYENATILQLIDTTGLSRGAIYYYAEDKESLFNEVVDEYLLESQSFFKKIDYKNFTSLHHFVMEYVGQIKKATEELMLIPGNTSRAYLCLILQASNYYPGFNEKLVSLFERDHQMWEEVLQKAITTGEIRADVDVKQISRKFWRVYLGYSLEVCFIKNVDADELLLLYQEMYAHIKA